MICIKSYNKKTNKKKSKNINSINKENKKIKINKITNNSKILKNDELLKNIKIHEIVNAVVNKSDDGIKPLKIQSATLQKTPKRKKYADIM